jgi:hypothetical protein
MMTEGVKILEGNEQFPALEALNSLSSRLSSFTIPVRGERFTDLFLELLDFSNKNAEMP